MTTSNSQITQTYRSEEAQAILKIAIARKEEGGELTRGQLFEIATELGIAQEDLLAAEQEWLAHTEEDREKQVFNAYRRGRLKQSFVKFAIANSFLMLLNLISAHEFSWALYILLGWGLFLTLKAWNVYQMDGEEYEQAFQRWRLRKQVGQSINTLAGRVRKWLQE